MPELTHPENSPDTSKAINERANRGTKNAGIDSIDVDELAKGEIPQSSKSPAGSNKKPQKDINDLAEFLAYAYSRKGQRLSLQPKVEKAICKRARLDAESRTRLLAIAKEDILLAVPRQILLSVRKSTVYSTLKSTVRGFIEDVLNMHPAFSIPELEGVLNNIEHATEPRRALTALVATDYSKLPDLPREKPLKPKDYEMLRVNACYLLAVWFSETRGLSSEKLTQHLFAALWQPQTLTATDETVRLQILTDIRDLSGVGIACLGFKRQVDQQMQNADFAKRNAESAVDQLRSLEMLYKESKQDGKHLEQEISELRKTLEMEKQAHENTRVHLNDDLEYLRSRILRRLKAEVSLLDEGLHALRSNPPKIRVVEDHVERVFDGLKKEMKEFGSDG
ncbi:hypothetical protein [Candidatus Spongiihabitans sp.]|uniref:hypothetical protein n=1 Tax=Candidatus Spongiihabitans sp. TaxID=3101308 RepID=UPI003C7E40B2